MTSSAIKFTPAKGKSISNHCGITSYSDAFLIGALELTAQQTFPDENTFYRHYQTDKKGLELASMKAGELVTALHIAIKTIGVLMVYCEEEQIQQHQDNIGWLIAGLSELASDVSEANLNMQESISNYDRCAEGQK